MAILDKLMFWRPRQRAPTQEQVAPAESQVPAPAQKQAASQTRTDVATRRLLRSGRLTDSGAFGWGWNPLAFMGRRNQRAHQTDFTKLKTYTAAELLRILADTHPDVSDAVWQFLRIGDTPASFTVKRLSGKEDSAGQAALTEMLNGIGAPGLGTGFDASGNFRTRQAAVRLTLLVRGAMCVEVEPTPNLRGVAGIHVIDPSEIEFRKDPDGRLIPWQRVESPPRSVPPEQRHLWQGNYKRLDSPTIIWEALDPFVGDPYGREPLLPVLQVIFFEIQVLQDLQAVVHNQGYPRLEVKILQEALESRILQAHPHLQSDPDEFQKVLDKWLNDIAANFEALEPDDTVTHYDTTEMKAIGVEGKGPMIDVKKLIEIIEARIATSCKTFLTMLSRHTGTAEGARATDTLIYQKSVAGIQAVAASGWGRALTVALNLLGRQGVVEFTYEAPDLRTPDQQEKDFGARRGNARALFDDGLLDEAGYYQYVFDRAPDEATRRRMAEKLKPKPTPRGGGDGSS